MRDIYGLIIVRRLGPLLMSGLFALFGTYQYIGIDFIPETPNQDMARHAAMAADFFSAVSSGQLIPRLRLGDGTIPDLPVFQYYGFMTGLVSLPLLAVGLPALPAMVLGVLWFRVLGLVGVYLRACPKSC